MSITTLSSEIRQRRRALDQEIGESKAIAVRGQAVMKEVARLTKDVELYEKVAVVLNSIGETRQNTAQKQIESLVTRGLQVIFGEELSFHLIQKTGKTSQIDFVVRTTLETGATLDTPVMEARGGGLAATVGFLLRLVVMLLSKKQENSVLFLDETFSMVSAEYIDRVSEFLREIVDKTGIQIIMVTHQPALSENADRVYRFSLDSAGLTQVKESD